MLKYTINPNSEIPIYRQLVNQINAEIRSGVLETGTQLPTVREMAERMNLSCGTVKRVYDQLREMGDIEMTRRRGSFVKYVREDSDNRKLQAMNAIDRMIRRLSELSFSPAEIQIFLNLKMREWGLKWSGVRVAVTTDCPELVPTLEKQLERMGNVKVIICDTRQLREYPYSVNEEADVILASPEDSRKILPVLPERSKLIQVAFSVSPECLYSLGGMNAERTGILCLDAEFAALVRRYLPASAAENLRVLQIGDSFADLDAVVLPPEWENLFSQEVLARLEGKKRIQFDYGIDEGSMLYLEERIGRIRDERQLQPGALRF